MDIKDIDFEALKARNFQSEICKAVDEQLWFGFYDYDKAKLKQVVYQEGRSIDELERNCFQRLATFETAFFGKDINGSIVFIGVDFKEFKKVLEEIKMYEEVDFVYTVETKTGVHTEIVMKPAAIIDECLYFERTV